MESGHHLNAFEELYRNFWKAPNGASPLGRNKAGAQFLRNHGLLLDVGCGEGALLDLIKDQYDEVHGIDIAQGAVELCLQKGMKAKRVDLNVEDIPYEAYTFDSVACFDFIEHVLSPMRFLAEAYRVLKWDGEIVVVTPNIRYFWGIARLIFKGRFPKTSSEMLEPYDGGHIHYFTSNDITEMLSKQGFQNIQCFGWGKGVRRSFGLLTKFLLGPTIGREFLHGGIIVRAEKIKG